MSLICLIRPPRFVRRRIEETDLRGLRLLRRRLFFFHRRFFCGVPRFRRPVDQITANERNGPALDAPERSFFAIQEQISKVDSPHAHDTIVAAFFDLQSFDPQAKTFLQERFVDCVLPIAGYPEAVALLFRLPEYTVVAYLSVNY